jgi:predicted tellurium resistance membrane protein TerC
MFRTDAGARLSRNMAWVFVWVGLGLAVGLLIALTQGRDAATEYVAAYLLEESLSVDNIFVFVVIFSELHIPAEHQRRLLLFGIAGALVFRGLAIGAGITLIERVQWITYPFALLVLFAAWRLLFGVERERKVVKEACAVCGTWIARVVRVSQCCTGTTSGDAKAAGSSRRRSWWLLSSSKRPTSCLRSIRSPQC